ncbi:MAG: hypothetical protein H0U32_06810, partial [Thermoleophilaceae bacterium]|nr:hypothetical protein [Thermoleophilaceae bacterium]
MKGMGRPGISWGRCCVALLLVLAVAGAALPETRSTRAAAQGAPPATQIDAGNGQT